MVFVLNRFSFLLKSSFLLLLLYTLLESEVNCQGYSSAGKEGVPFSYDEIPVLVIVEGYNNFYLNALYANNDLLYVNVEELFRSLKIHIQLIIIQGK